MASINRSFINYLLLALIVLCFALYLRDIDYSQLRGVRPTILWLLLASAIAMAFRYLGVFVWRRILLDLGARQVPRFRLLASIYAKAWMGRYLPGKITWIAGKIYLAGSLGISRSRLTVASTLEAIVQIVAMTTVSLLLVGFDVRTDVIAPQIKVVLVLLALALIVLLHPAIFNFLIQKAFSSLVRLPVHPELRGNMRSVLVSFTLYSFGAFVSGASYFFLTLSLVDSVPWHLFLYIVGAYGLAGAIGMAVPLLPSGLGIRDGMQLVLLSAVFPKETALVLVVYSRLWSSLIDVLFYLLATVLDSASAQTHSASLD